MGRSKNAKEQLADVADELREHLPSKDEVLALLPDKEDVIALKDHVVDGLPDSVSEHLPGEKKKKGGKLKKLLFGGALIAAATAAFVVARNRIAGQPVPPHER